MAPEWRALPLICPRMALPLICPRMAVLTNRQEGARTTYISRVHAQLRDIFCPPTPAAAPPPCTHAPAPVPLPARMPRQLSRSAQCHQQLPTTNCHQQLPTIYPHSLTRKTKSHSLRRAGISCQLPEPPYATGVYSRALEGMKAAGHATHHKQQGMQLFTTATFFKKIKTNSFQPEVLKPENLQRACTTLHTHTQSAHSNSLENPPPLRPSSGTRAKPTGLAIRSAGHQVWPTPLRLHPTPSARCSATHSSSSSSSTSHTTSSSGRSS